MPDAVIYARYSSHNQRDASIDDQVRVCREAAERAGDRIVEVYADRARSGRDATKRAEFLRMMDDAKSGGWRRVYLYKTDRFARNRYDAAIYRAELKKHGVAIIAVMEPMSDGPEGILIETMMEGLAEYYSANLAQNVRRGLEGNALKCMHNGCALFGYTLGADGYYHVNEGEAQIVRRAFEVYSNGGTAGDVERELAAYRTPRGARFTKQRILKMLKNEKYAGTYVFGEHRVEDGMEAIVSHEVWDRVNDRLGGRHGKSADFPLTGKLFDGEGRHFVGHSARSATGRIYRYYQVNATGERYPKGAVEGAVYSAVAALLDEDEDLVDELADAVMAAQGESEEQHASDADALRARIAELDRKADNYVDAIGARGADERLMSRLRDVEDEREALMVELEEAEAHERPRLKRETVVALLRLIILAEAPEGVMAAFVDRVTIDGDEMSVRFRLAEGLLKGAAAPEDTPQEGTKAQLELAVRPVTNWLPCRDCGQTIAVFAGPFHIIVVVPWVPPKRRRRSGHG